MTHLRQLHTELTEATLSDWPFGLAVSHVRGDHYRYDDRMLRRLNSPTPQELKDAAHENGGKVPRYTIELVPIKKINIPPVWKPARAEAILKGILAGKKLPPIDAAKNKGSRWTVDDGIHRANVSKRLGFKFVPVLVKHLVDAPAELMGGVKPEQAKLRVGAKVKLDTPDEGETHGRIVAYLYARKIQGTLRHRYEMVGAKDEWAILGDLWDNQFKPV